MIKDEKVFFVGNDCGDQVVSYCLVVGDVLFLSWGYEQINVDYYQVMWVVGYWLVEIRKIV